MAPHEARLVRWRVAFGYAALASLIVVLLYGPLFCAVLTLIVYAQTPETTLNFPWGYVWFLMCWVSGAGALIFGLPVSAALVRYRRGLGSFMLAAVAGLACAALLILAADQTVAVDATVPEGSAFLAGIGAKLRGPANFAPFVFGYVFLFWFALRQTLGGKSAGLTSVSPSGGPEHGLRRGS